MKDIIKEVDRLEDEENDFIYANNIKISEFLKFSKDQNKFKDIIFDDENKNYTKFVMTVINTMIKVVHDGS